MTMKGLLLRTARLLVHIGGSAWSLDDKFLMLALGRHYIAPLVQRLEIEASACQPLDGEMCADLMTG